MAVAIDVVKTLDEAFKSRTLTHHGANRSVLVFPCRSEQAMLVLDVAISRKILTSTAFAGFNYFKPGIDRLADKGTPAELLAKFYDETVLFKEGEEHRALKSAFGRILAKSCADLEASRPLIHDYFRKRKARISSPLEFSDALVRLCFGLIISRLTTIPLKRVYRSLSLRHNVFFSYFNPPRQLSANEALTRLYGGATPPEKGAADWHAHLLAQSLIIMGIDPTAGTICAGIVEGRTERLSAGVYRYCPTSYVSRICVQPTAIGGIDFQPGDICFVSLVPAEGEAGESCPAENSRNTSLSFGVGVHACIGKHLSLAVLDIAEEVLDNVFSHGFDRTSIIDPDGAFLAFRD